MADPGKVGKTLIADNTQNLTFVAFHLRTERRERTISRADSPYQLTAFRGHNFLVSDRPFGQHFTDDITRHADICRQGSNINGNV